MKTSKILIKGGILIVLFALNCYANAPGWLLQAMYKADKIKVSDQSSILILHHTEDARFIQGKYFHKAIRFAQQIRAVSGKKYARLSEYISPNRQITNLKGWHLLPSGKLQILTDLNIRIISASEIANYHDDIKILMANFENIEVGSVVAFEYEVEEDGPGAAFQQFKFQEEQPVKFSQFSLTLPKGWQFHKKETRLGSIKFNKKNNRYIWSAKALNFEPREQHTPPWERLTKQLDLTIFNPDSVGGDHFSDWQSVANWWSRLFKPKTQNSAPIKAMVENLTTDLETPLEKANAIANFVRDEIRYVAIEIGKGRWQPRPPHLTLHNRFGDCKDKTVLMQSMLAVINIKSTPVFTNTSTPIYEALPTPFQFNHCIIGIPIKTNKSADWLFFDPTVPSLPLGKLPQRLHGKTAFIPTNKDSLFIKLPDSETREHYRRCVAEANMKSDGSITALVKITDYGNWAAETDYQLTLKPLKYQIEFWKSYIAKTVPNVVLSDFETGSARDSTWVSFKMEGKKYAAKTGNIRIFKPNLFAINELATITAIEREHPIWLGHARQIDTNITWNLPKGWTVEETPWNIKSHCAIASVNGETALQASRLKYQANLKYNGQVLPAVQLLKLKEFNSGLSEIKNLTIILSQTQSAL